MSLLDYLQTAEWGSVSAYWVVRNGALKKHLVLGVYETDALHENSANGEIVSILTTMTDEYSTIARPKNLEGKRRARRTKEEMLNQSLDCTESGPTVIILD